MSMDTDSLTLILFYDFLLCTVVIFFSIYVFIVGLKISLVFKKN